VVISLNLTASHRLSIYVHEHGFIQKSEGVILENSSASILFRTHQAVM